MLFKCGDSSDLVKVIRTSDSQRKSYYLHNSSISIITTETNNNVLYPYDILAQLELI